MRKLTLSTCFSSFFFQRVPDQPATEIRPDQTKIERKLSVLLFSTRNIKSEVFDNHWPLSFFHYFSFIVDDEKCVHAMHNMQHAQYNLQVLLAFSSIYFQVNGLKSLQFSISGRQKVTWMIKMTQRWNKPSLSIPIPRWLSRKLRSGSFWCLNHP